MKRPSIFLLAGEASGDLHGERLVEALYQRFPQAEIRGVGGPKMRLAGLHCIATMESFEVMGFIDVFFALPRLVTQFFRLRKHLLADPPDLFLSIDYPGFNLALAKSLSKRAFPGKLCHYICPSVWAWGKKRIPKMEQTLDVLFAILPFEQECFNPEKLSVHFVGHPLVQQVMHRRSNPFNIDRDLRVLALFPGSREKELNRNFPLQLKVAARLLQTHSDLLIAISVSRPQFSPILEELLHRAHVQERDRILFVDRSQNSALMQRADLAIAKSGTVNLELALHSVPTVVTYGISPLDLFIARNVLKIRLPYYSLPNLIAKQEVFPELIGPHFTEEALFNQTQRFLTQPSEIEACREKCRAVGQLLGEEKHPEQEIARVIQTLLT